MVPKNIQLNFLIIWTLLCLNHTLQGISYQLGIKLSKDGLKLGRNFGANNELVKVTRTQCNI